MMQRALVFLCCCVLMLSSAVSADTKSASPAKAYDWGVLSFPALERYNLVTFYLKWAEAAQTALQETVQLGITRLLVAKTWHELEPKKDGLNLDDLAKQLATVHQSNLAVYFGLQLINTHKRELPDDLADLEWDDPALRQRLFVLLDKILPLLAEGGAFYLSIGNEVDVYFAKHPDEIEAYGKLFVAVRDYVRQRYPAAILGITATDEGLRGERSELIRRLNRDTDVMMLTYYPTKDMKVLPPDAPRRDLPRMVAFAAGKPVVLQEVGYPSAAGVGSSLEAQADFIRVFFEVWGEQRQAIPYISLFLQTDVGTRICDQWTRYYGFESHRQLFADFICTLGLKDAYGQPKPAWTLLKDEIAPRLRHQP